MKKLSLVLCFVLILVALFAINVFADKNVAKDAALTHDSGCWVITPSKLIDGDYFTSSGGSHGEAWVNFDFNFTDDREIAKIFLVTNSSGHMANIGDKNSLTTLDCPINVRGWNKAGDKLFDVYTTNCNDYNGNESIALYTDAATGKQYVGYTYNVNYQDLARIQVSIFCNYNNSAAFWEIEIWEHDKCDFSNLVERTLEPTCTTDGSYVYECACGRTETRVISCGDGKHSYDNGVVTTDPTTEADGVRTFTCTECNEKGCTNCPGYQYTETIPALGHNWDNGTVTPPTCTERGYTTYRCTDEGCTETKIEDYTSVIPHDYTYRTEVTIKATVLNEGLLTHYCVCGDSQTEVTSKLTWGNNTSVIGPQNILKYTPTYSGSPQAASDPKKLFDGKVNSYWTQGTGDGWFGPTNSTLLIEFDQEYYVISFRFLVWSNYNSATIQLLDANGKEINSYSRTDISDTGASSWFTATDLAESIGVKYVKITINGAKGEYGQCLAFQELEITVHNHDIEGEVEEYIPETCTTNGSYYATCSVCGLRNFVEVLATGHTATDEGVVTAPTCTEDGYTTHVCATCGVSYTVDPTKATGHEWVKSGELAPTCTEKGYTSYECIKCGETKTDEIAATGHTEVVDAAVDPTCTETGLTEGKHCDVCGEIIVAQETVDALGHTPSEDGAVCTVCNATLIAAYIGETPYATLEEAYAAANAGDTITLFANIDLASALYVDKKVTINLNGKTITATNDTVGDGVFCSVAGGELIIVGDGTVNGLANNPYSMAIWAKGGIVIIEGGTYTNVGATSDFDGDHFDLIYVSEGGYVEITGGTFTCETPEWTLNSKNSNPGTINVYGGTFTGFNPFANKDGECFLAANYCSTEEADGTYTVGYYYDDNHSHSAVGEGDYTYVDSTCVSTGYLTDKCYECGKKFYVSYAIDSSEYGHEWSEGVRNSADTGYDYECILCKSTKTEITKGTASEPIDAQIGNNVVTTIEGLDFIVYQFPVTYDLGKLVITVSENASICITDSPYSINPDSFVTGNTSYEVTIDSLEIWGFPKYYAIAVKDCDSFIIEYTELERPTLSVGANDIQIPEGKPNPMTGMPTAGTAYYVVKVPGSYILSAAEGEENAVITINGELFWLAEGAYEFTVAEGESVIFAINSDLYIMEEINLVLTCKHANVVVDEAKDATCTETGLTEGSHCGTCGETIVAQETVEAKGHSYEITENEDGSVTYTCENCGDAYTDYNSLINGNYFLGTDPVVFENGVLTAMGATYNYTYDVTTGMITTNSAGLFFQVIDGTIHFRGAQPLHQHVEGGYITEVTEPTCTEPGYTTYICQYCGPLFTADETEATGHSIESFVENVPADCTKDGYSICICADCGEEYTIVLPADPVNGHRETVYGSGVTVDPTCKSDGTYTYTCSVCNEEIVEITPASEDYHAPAEGVEPEVVYPTCSATGYKKFTCVYCEETIETIYDWVGNHDFNEAGVCTICGTNAKGTAMAPIVVTIGENTFYVVDGADYTIYMIPVTYDLGKLVVTVSADASIAFASNPYDFDYAPFETGSTTYEVVLDSEELYGAEYYAIAIANCETFTVAYEEMARPELVEGPNAIVVPEIETMWGTSAGTVIVVVKTPGSYILSLADGEENACVVLDGERLYLDEKAYEFTVDEGEVVKFSITTDDWSGDTIDLVLTVKAPAHVHTEVEIPAVLPTPSVDGYTAGIMCSECGETIKAPVKINVTELADTRDPNFRVASAALSLQDSISVLYKSVVTTGYNKPYMVFVFRDSEYTVTEYDIEASTGRLVFSFDEVLPQWMNSNIKAYVYAETAEGEYSRNCILEYSVKQYCINQLKKNQAKLTTLISDVLVYGSWVQKYVSYETNNLIYDIVASEGYTLTPSMALDSLVIDSSVNVQSVTGDRTTGTDWKSGALRLGEVTKVELKFVASDIENLQLKINIDGTDTYYEVTEDMWNAADKRYVLTIDTIKSYQYGDTITATFVKDGAQIGSTLTYSINTYLYRNYTNTTHSELARNMMRALYVYGESVYNYFN